MIETASSSDAPILSADDLVGGLDASETAPFVVLADPRARLAPRGVDALIRRMAADGAAVGFGRIAGPGTRTHSAPARIEDLRFRQSVASAAVVLRREVLVAALGAGRPCRDDPVRHWRLVRDAAAACRVLRTDIDLASLPEEAERDGDALVPIDLAGPHPIGHVPDDLILVYGEIDASVSLYFDGLPPNVARRVRYLRPSAAVLDLPHLLAAALVVIVRSFEFPAEAGTLDLMDAMGVPYAWFVDDHVLKLAEDQEGFAYYSPDHIAAFAARTRGIMASTPALADVLAAYGRPVLTWPCVVDPTLAGATVRPAAATPFAVGLVGGSFRRAGLLGEVMPALDAFDPARRTRIHGRFDFVRGVEDPRVIPTPVELSFRQFVHLWRGFGCHVLAHPRGEAANMPFKSPATLLVARYLGAVPVVAASDPAYAGLGEREGVLIADATPAAWAAAFRRAADPDIRRELSDRLEAWCRARFDPADAVPRVAALDAWAERATVVERERRLRRALAMPRFPDLRGVVAAGALAASDPPPRPGIGLRARWFLLRQARRAALATGTLDRARRLRERWR